MDIYLYGSGGHAKVILDILYRQGRSVTALIDDHPPLGVSAIHGVPIQPATELDRIHPDRTQWLVAIGNNQIRQAIAEKLTYAGHQFTTAIHPSAQIAIGVTVAPGTVVMANAVINTDAQIGHHVIVNTGATIDHDCVIQDYTHIAPGCSLCGQVKCGVGVLLGVGSAVKPMVEIGEKTVCGAGSVVVRSLPANCLAYGCPAQVVKMLAIA